MKIVKLPRQNLEEWFVTAPANARGECHRHIRDAGAVIVTEDLFGITGNMASNWPVTWLRGNPALPGVHLHAVKGVLVERLTFAGRVVGSVFNDGLARHCRLGGLRPASATASPSSQARATFELLEAALRDAGMTFANVARTWFYLNNILAWYGDFNKVRDEFFRKRNVFDGLVPASTGVGGANIAGTALMAGAYAVTGGQLVAVPSPLQCPAPKYGSSFSRAVELKLPDHCRLWISGTASIAPEGKTVHVCDVAGQIALTMQVVAAILESRGLNWQDASRTIAYVSEATMAQQFQEYRAANGLTDLPVLTTENVICRDDLLFEIELDAGRLTAAKSSSESALNATGAEPVPQKVRTSGRGA